MTRGESRLSEAGSAPNGGSTVYGMPTYENRRVAIDEVHARPYLLIESPRALVQLAFMNEGNLAKDKATLAEISSRMGASLPDQNSPLHGLTWDQGKLIPTPGIWRAKTRSSTASPRLGRSFAASGWTWWRGRKRPRPTLTASIRSAAAIRSSRTAWRISLPISVRMQMG